MKFVVPLEERIAKRILESENINIETICIEIPISKRKWCLTFAYRPPYNNKATFFMELKGVYAMLLGNTKIYSS